MSGIKRDTDDALFSTLVRERAEWRCEFPGCGRYFPEGERHKLHCSHVYGRRRVATRHDPDNALSLCAYHHDYVGENPPIHVGIVLHVLGQIRYDALTLRANGVLKLTAGQRAARRRHLKAELEILRVRRSRGETGRLEFKAFDPAEYEEVVAPRKRKKARKVSKFKKKLDGTVVLREKDAA